MRESVSTSPSGYRNDKVLIWAKGRTAPAEDGHISVHRDMYKVLVREVSSTTFSNTDWRPDGSGRESNHPCADLAHLGGRASHVPPTARTVKTSVWLSWKNTERWVSCLLPAPNISRPYYSPAVRSAVGETSPSGNKWPSEQDSLFDTKVNMQRSCLTSTKTRQSGKTTAELNGCAHVQLNRDD